LYKDSSNQSKLYSRRVVRVAEAQYICWSYFLFLREAYSVDDRVWACSLSIGYWRGGPVVVESADVLLPKETVITLLN
jgi:hypothetical protein